MPRIKGQIESILNKRTSKGKEYEIIRIDGNGYFDWNGKASAHQIKESDFVEIEYKEGKYPTLLSIRKIKEPIQKTVDSVNNQQTVTRNNQIARQVALKCAVRLLSNDRFLSESKDWVTATLTFAEEFYKWLTEEKS